MPSEVGGDVNQFDIQIQLEPADKEESYFPDDNGNYYGSEPSSASSIARSLALEQLDTAKIADLSTGTATAAETEPTLPAADVGAGADAGGHGHSHGHHTKPPIAGPVPGKTYLRMFGVSLIFFTLGFVPLMSTQHHSEEVLLSTSQQHPAMVHMSYYSQYSVDVIAAIEGQPFAGAIAETSSSHGRRMMLEAQQLVTMEAYLIEALPEVAKAIADGSTPLSEAVKISLGFPMKLKEDVQHLHFSLDGDELFNHDETNVLTPGNT